MADREYQVGRRQGGKLVPAFRLKRTAQGGIKLTDVQSLNDAERMLVLAHFGSMLRATTGMRAEQHRRLFQPGTKEHFEYAVCELPPPFALMRRPR